MHFNYVWIDWDFPSTFRSCAAELSQVLLVWAGTVKVQDYYKGAADPESGKLVGGSSMMQVLVNRSAFCVQVRTRL